MAASKTATLTFRIDPALKEALRLAANLEHRSIANMVEVLIRDYCEQRGMGSPPFSRTLTRRPIEAMRSVHVEAKEVQCGVQARCC